MDNFLIDDGAIRSSEEKNCDFKNSSDKDVLQNKTGILGLLAAMIPAGAGIKDMLSSDVDYRAIIPVGAIKKMATGEYGIMESKKGELLANIIDTTKTGGGRIVHNLKLEAITPDKVQAASNFGLAISQIVVQQQMMAVISLLKDIQEKVTEIKRGQQTDRFGKIFGAVEQLQQARSLKYDDCNKKTLIAGAVSMLNEGKEQLALWIKEELPKLEGILVKGKGGRLKTMCENLYNPITGKSPVEEIEEKFKCFDEAMKVYMKAVICLVFSYSLLGSKEPIFEIIESAKKFISANGKVMKEVSQYAVDGDPAPESWYISSNNELERLDFKSPLMLPHEVETVAIQFKGKELLEAC